MVDLLGDVVKTALIWLLLLLLMATTMALADDGLEAPWPVAERCIFDPIQPPDGWAFEGTIIAEGWAGIHGMRAAWETPQVLAFRSGWIEEDGYGTLSPDGRYYAIPQATLRSDPNSFYGRIVDVTRLLVYDLTDQEDTMSIEWPDTYDVFFGSGASRYYDFRIPVWFDENTIIHQRGDAYYLVHVPDLDTEVWLEPTQWLDVSPVWRVVSHPSPDWSRIVVRGSLFNTEAKQFMADVYNPTANIDVPSVAWHPNSTEFIISGSLSTTLYDADGNLLDIVSSASEETLNDLYIRQNAYSPDGTQFWLTIRPEVSRAYTSLGLANRTDRTIIDTCLDSGASVQFSPDGQFIAILGLERGLQELRIFDIANWQLFKTGIYHDGQIIGWRAS
jgi:WD40 repeat protein